jgi:hypothetical protein
VDRAGSDSKVHGLVDASLLLVLPGSAASCLAPIDVLPDFS